MWQEKRSRVKGPHILLSGSRSSRSLLTFRFTYMILYVMKEFSTQVLRSYDMRAMVKALAIPDWDEENNRKGPTSS